MPELPEVEIQVRQLRRHLRGAFVRAVEVRDPKIKLPATLVGQAIRRVSRRGKFIVLQFGDDVCLLAHLRMTGWFEFKRPAAYRWALLTSRGGAYFTDPRRFGTVELLATASLLERFKHLGPEPLVQSFNLKCLQQTSRVIKVALLDQHLIAGIGNIYASESLWRARIDPRRRADRLRPDELSRLRRGIVTALRKGVNYGPRIFEVQQFAVYDRDGRPCRRCRTNIRKVVQAQRSTYYCPSCQR